MTDLRSFLGYCSVLRRLVLNFAHLASPLSQKLKKDLRKKFGPLNYGERNLMKTCQKKLISQPVLAWPDAEGHYTLKTDTCDVHIGCMLWQEQPAKTREPIGYCFIFLTKVVKTNGTTQRECLAKICSTFLLRSYLEVGRFIIRTDHDSLGWMLIVTDESRRLAQWRLRLLEFAFDVVHRAGVLRYDWRQMGLTEHRWIMTSQSCVSKKLTALNTTVRFAYWRASPAP